jgi:hypothetical protein
MGPFEIFNAVHSWNNCRDMRPWLIVELRDNHTLGCFPISGECYDGNCFWISASHADFPATGLSNGSYVHDRYIIELDVSQFADRRGALSGALLDEFLAYSGL